MQGMCIFIGRIASQRQTTTLIANFMDIETKALSERHARTLIQKRGGEFCPPSKEEMHSPEIENNRHSGSARMKERLFAGLLFISILSFASCGKDSATDPATNADPIDLTFNATSALSDVLEIPAGESLWENAETFGVYVASADPTRNVSASLAVKEGKSSGAVRVNHFETGNTASFYYPYSKENDDKGMQNITCTIAATQSQGEAGVFDAANMPMASLVQTLNAETASPAQTVEMHALGGILRVKVHASGQYAGETLLSVEYSDEKTPMAGSFTLDLSALKSESALVAPECDGHSVKTTLSGGASYAVPASADAAKAVHAVMAAGSYDGTLTLTTDKAVYTQPASCKVERGACCDLTVDLSTTESRQTIDGLWNGSGTAEDPYQIATADDLELLATFCNDASKNSEYADKLTLVKDLVLADENYGIAGRKGSALIAAINAELVKLTKDGTMATIAEAYGLQNEICVDATQQITVDTTESDYQYVTGKGEVVVGYTLFAPIAYKRNDKLEGFDIDLAKKVFENMGLTVTFQLIDWDTKEVELQSKTIDLIWNGMTITDERLAAMEISIPYMKNKQVAVIRKEDADKYTADTSTWKKATLIAESGSAGEGCIVKKK